MNNFPFFKQLDSKDCGPTCLRIIAKYYGKSFSAQYLREITHVDREGVSLLSISKAAESVGFRTIGCKINFEQLKECLLPCIMYWKGKHFIVVYKITKSKVYVSDPAFGLIVYSIPDFLKEWNFHNGQITVGIILQLEPSIDFYESDNNSSSQISLSHFLNYLRPYKRYYFQLFLGMLVGMLFSLITPFLTQSMVDVGIGGNNLGFIKIILAGQVTLAISSTILGFIRSWILLQMGTKMSLSIITDYLIKLLKLPIVFFDKKTIGDIMQRMGDHSRIQGFISSTTLNTVFSLINFIVFAVIMAYYDGQILFVFLIGSTIYAGWVAVFLKKRKQFDYKMFEQSSAKQTVLIQLIGGIRDVKLHNFEKQKRWEWERLQAKSYKLSIKQLILGQYQQIGGVFIDQTKNIIVSYMTARSVINGEMTFGMMLSMQYILGQLNSPISQLIGLLNSYQDAKTSFERISEVHQEKEEESDLSKNLPLDMNSMYDGSITIENLNFSYGGPLQKKILENINLSLPAGKITAIVGSSGSGKTTLMKILLKFYNDYEGNIKLGSVNLNFISNYVWRDRCGSVMQDGFIFSDTIAANISIGEDFCDLIRLEQAMSIANIGEFVNSLPNGIHTKIGNEGINLSQGQRQRILIARAVYKNPDFLFFDEATNALDSNNEKVIVNNLDEFFKGKTVLIIAHRLSTVKNADQIIVLESGKIVEVGNHQSLISNDGYYFNLIKNQLELANES